jgi:hypothetical protein
MYSIPLCPRSLIITARAAPAIRRQQGITDTTCHDASAPTSSAGSVLTGSGTTPST